MSDSKRLHKFEATVTSLEEAESRKTALVIVNPNSGKKKGLKALEIARPILESVGIEVQVKETTHAGHCGEICETEDLSEVDIVIPIGGDGTLHEACNGLMQRQDDAAKRVIIAIIPAGSGNTLAFDLHMNDIVTAVNVVVRGTYRAIDLAKVSAIDKDTGEDVPDIRAVYSINMVGWAMPSAVLASANSFRKYGLGAQYDFAARKYILTNKSYKGKITWITGDGQSDTVESKVALMVVQNSVHLGNKLPLAPQAKLDDGKLDLTIMYNRDVFTNIGTFNLAKKGMHTTREQVYQTQCTQVILQPSDNRLIGRNTVNIDGELNGPSPCKITVVPGAVRIFCPV